MRYKVVRRTDTGVVTIKGSFRTKKDAEMFIDAYKKVTPHVKGELVIEKDEPTGAAWALVNKLWGKSGYK